MSRSGDRLEALLAELARAEGSAAAPAPGLEARRPCAVRRGSLIAEHDERKDPITGHRGVAEGLHLLVRAGEWLVDLQLREERSGVVLRGQLLPMGAESTPPLGGMVHARAGGESALACIDAAGEFVLRGLPAAVIDRLVLELDDELHELPWPAELLA